MELTFRRHVVVDSPVEGCELQAMAFDDAGEYLCLWSAGSSHWATRSLDPTPLAVDPGRHIAHPVVASLPDGAFVISNSRADPKTGPSSWRFDSAGKVTGEGSLGDGIAHLQSTPDGDLWVGYFDEGIYGGGEVAHHGLVRFDEELTPDWLFPFTSEFGPIDDCYALNVKGETATAYSYSGFSIVQIRGGELVGWAGAPPGADGLLVEADRCVLVGGYREDRRVATEMRLTNEGIEVLSRGTVDGPPESQPLARLCRGPDMYVVAGREVFLGSMT